jgi:hypothetical protein
MSRLMDLRRRRLVVLLFALLVAAWTIVHFLHGADTGLLYLAPALLVCAPLVAGRYVGEEQLAQLAARAVTQPSRRVGRLCTPGSHVRVMQRGGRLVASSLAKRPPPVVAAVLIP